MAKWKKLAHVVYQCMYHIVWCPKYRYRILKGAVGKYVEETIKQLCDWKKVEVMELNVQEDHVHVVVSIPPKVSITELMGILKVKAAIRLFKSYPGLKSKPYWGNHFWSRDELKIAITMDPEFTKAREAFEKLDAFLHNQ